MTRAGGHRDRQRLSVRSKHQSGHRISGGRNQQEDPTGPEHQTEPRLKNEAKTEVKPDAHLLSPTRAGPGIEWETAARWRTEQEIAGLRIRPSRPVGNQSVEQETVRHTKSSMGENR
jgi:hypothetical protein